MPNLNRLPPGASVFVDTNIFYMHFTGKSSSCTTLFMRIALGDVTGYVNTEVLSDLLHKLMLYEAHVKGFITSGSAAKLKRKLLADRTVIANMPDHQNLFETVLNTGVKVIRISKKMFIETKSERQAYGLMTNDSLHLGSMLRHSVPIANIATKDADFAHIPGIDVWEPLDIT